MKTTDEHPENEFPTLEQLKGKSGFTTPEGYFDSLQRSILSQTIEVSKAPKVFSMYRVLGYTASVALIASIASVFFLGRNDQSTLDEFGQLTVNDYFEEVSGVDLELEETLEFDEMAMN